MALAETNCRTLSQAEVEERSCAAASFLPVFLCWCWAVVVHVGNLAGTSARQLGTRPRRPVPSRPVRPSLTWPPPPTDGSSRPVPSTLSFRSTQQQRRAFLFVWAKQPHLFPSGPFLGTLPPAAVLVPCGACPLRARARERGWQVATHRHRGTRLGARKSPKRSERDAHAPDLRSGEPGCQRRKGRRVKRLAASRADDLSDRRTRVEFP